MSKDNKILEERLHKTIFEPCWHWLDGEEKLAPITYHDFADDLVYDVKRTIDELREKDLKAISFHFAIPVEDLEKVLRSKDD